MLTKPNLFDFMDEFNDYDASDGAWWAMLENSVTLYNKKFETHHDPFDSVHEWIEQRDTTE